MTSIWGRDFMQCRAHLRTSLVFLGVLLLLTRCATNRDLMREAAQGHTATVQTFLAQGVDGNTIDRDGKTALMLAAFEGHTALTLAQARGREDVFKPNPQTKEPPTGPVVTPIVANTPAPKISLTEPGNRQRLGGLAIETSNMRLAGMVTEGVGPVKLFIN